MKKRAMKKYIPKDTVYCGDCRWRHFLGTIFLHRNPEDCPNNPVEKCDLEWIQLICPICNRKSISHITHGTQVAIDDWNRYHT